MVRITEHSTILALLILTFRDASEQSYKHYISPGENEFGEEKTVLESRARMRSKREDK